jgi:hypothetical protein
MGFCSYCFQHAGSSYGMSDECFGWAEARSCSGIIGPDDPKRVARQKAHYLRKAKDLRADAKKIAKDAREKVAGMKRQAEALEREWSSR